MEEREARRRRIVERGSDRLALITGRVQTLAAPSPLPPSPSSSTSSSSAHSSEHHLSNSLPPLPSHRTHFRHKTEGDASDTSIEHNATSKFSRGNAFKYRNKAEIPQPKGETNISPIQASKVESKNEEQQPLLVSPKVPKASLGDKEASKNQINLFTAKAINSCIVSTENTRVCCSVIIALLVVLSNINLPLTIVKSTSTIASKPLYILLLTDVTIVALKLMQNRRDKEKTEELEEKVDQLKDGVNWVGAVQILEIGLVFYQTVRALFIDVSCYTVVVICGLCLV